MHDRHKPETLVLLLVVVLFGMAAVINRPLAARRASLSDAPDPATADAPPLIVFSTVVLGGFRGLIADALWLRLSVLQEQGRYVELIQLADWITKLEPRSPEVWGFHAWNLAYNVSVMTPDAEDRWRWVEHGLRLLRDEGRRYNPHDPRLYLDLSWLYQHKLGGVSDRMHAHYRRRWAGIVETVLPDGRFREEAFARDPAAARALRDRLGLELEPLRVVDAKYGPLDWRLPQAHAIYWAHRGENLSVDGHLPCARVLYHALADIVLGGPLGGIGAGRVRLFEPRLDLLPAAQWTFEEAMRRYETETLAVAYRHFLTEAVHALHHLGRRGQARALYRTLRTHAADPDLPADVETFVHR